MSKLRKFLRFNFETRTVSYNLFGLKEFEGKDTDGDRDWVGDQEFSFQLLSKVERFESTPEGQRWHLGGKVPLKCTLTHAEACRVRAGGHDLTPTRRAANLSYYELKSHAARPLEAICR